MIREGCWPISHSDATTPRTPSATNLPYVRHSSGLQEFIIGMNHHKNTQVAQFRSLLCISRWSLLACKEQARQHDSIAHSGRFNCTGFSLRSCSELDVIRHSILSGKPPPPFLPALRHIDIVTGIVCDRICHSLTMLGVRYSLRVYQ